MDTARTFMLGEANRGKEQMVFDWDKAAQIIKEKKPEIASAGLAGDWEYTGGMIWCNDKPYTDDYLYLASTWATPQICIDGYYIDCYKMASETPKWGAHTIWPDSSIKIVNGVVDQLPPASPTSINYEECKKISRV